MRLLYINNEGGALADYVTISPGTTVEQSLGEKMPGRKPVTAKKPALRILEKRRKKNE